MPYAVIADWDSQMKVSRYNYVETEPEAIAIVDKLRGIGPNALPSTKQAPNAYYAVMPPALLGTALFQHRARFWLADPTNQQVSFDTAACHAWQSKIINRSIEAEVDLRADKVFSPDNPQRVASIRLNLITRRQELQNKGRPKWTATERAEWDAGDVLNTRVQALQEAAQTLKNSLDAKTPEEVLIVNPSDNVHWPE